MEVDFKFLSPEEIEASIKRDKDALVSDAVAAEREACIEAAWEELEKMDPTLDWHWIKDAIRQRRSV